MKKIFFCVCLFFFSYVLFSNTIFIDSTVNIHQKKRKKDFQTIQITVRRTTYFARPHQIRKKQWL